MKRKYKTESARQAAAERNERMAAKGLLPATMVIERTRGIQRAQVYQWANQGKVRAEKIGKFMFLDEGDVKRLAREYLAGRAVGAAKAAAEVSR